LAATLVSNIAYLPQNADVPARPLELSVVIPTFNEQQNVRFLLAKLEHALDGIEWEAIWVDDHSVDGTPELLREVASSDRRVRLIERIGRRGLASASIEGMMASAAPYIAVMDADLQHDESILPEMLHKILSGRFDVVIASRVMEGGSMGEFSKRRVRLSHTGTWIAKLVCRCEVSDAMSGFFLVEAGFFRALAPRLTGSGFKILLDILSSSHSTPGIAEVPYHFGQRQFGESKLDFVVKLDYLFFIVDKFIGRWMPTRFLLFLCVGAVGVLVHSIIMASLCLSSPRHVIQFQVIATAAAMICNFLLNNMISFSDRKLRGRYLATGLLTFCAVCSLGTLIKINFEGMLARNDMQWWAVVGAGSIIGSIWNYCVNSIVTWRQSCR
jgi:dolichol-phosphate mannosyltransferase